MQRAVEEILSVQPAANADGAGITVAIFDAWPLNPPDMTSSTAPGPTALLAEDPFARIDGFIANIGAGANPRLEQFGPTGRAIPATNIYDYFSVYSTVGEDVTSTHGCCGNDLQRPYDLSSHGLFIADLLTDIAPAADVRVYRVLNNYGSGDAVTLVLAIESLLEEASDPRNASRQYVINLSLGAAVILRAIEKYINDPSLAFSDPAAWQLQVEGLGVPRAAPNFQQINADLISDGLARLTTDSSTGDQYLTFTGMLGKFEYLFSGKTLPSNVLVVAAAGNDSCSDTLFEPRLPAAIEGVLGVKAVDAAGTETYYSNIPDMASIDEGIGAFGGAIDPTTLACTGGMVGLYIGDYPSANNAPAGTAPGNNDTGFAQWSGTSFATPVAAAVAACVWSQQVSSGATPLTGQELRGQISLVGGTGSTLRDYIKDPLPGGDGKPLQQK